MAKRKRVILSWIPTEKNLLIMQNMGILNKHGRSAGRINLNEFLNRAVDQMIGIENPDQNGDLLEKVILSEIQVIQRRRDEYCKGEEMRLKELAQKLNEIRNQKKVRDYYETDKS